MAERTPAALERRRAADRAYKARPEVKEKRRQREESDSYRAAACERSRVRRLSKPDAERDAKLRARYGITLDEYTQMLEEQGGVCAACQEPPLPNRRLSVDHDHSTGAVRGLLCHHCNSALGHLRDDMARIKRLGDYLRKANG